jgi:hypothetical protein
VHPETTKVLLIRALAAVALTLGAAGCAGQPPAHTNSWLSYKYGPACADCGELRDEAEANAYYCSIGITGGSSPGGVDPASCAPGDLRP